MIAISPCIAQHGTSFGGDHVIEHAGDFSLVRVEHTIPVLW